MKSCYRCGFNDEDYGCTCPPYDKWYACPVENKTPENTQAFKKYITNDVLAVKEALKYLMEQGDYSLKDKKGDKMKPKFIIEARLKHDNSDRLNQIFTAVNEKDLDLSLEILNDHYYKVISIFKRNDEGNFILYDYPLKDRKETK